MIFNRSIQSFYHNSNKCTSSLEPRTLITVIPSHKEIGKNYEAYPESNSDHQHATCNKATALNASCLHLEHKNMYSGLFSSRRRHNIVKHLNVSLLRWDGWIRKQGLWRHGRCLSKNLTRFRFGGSKRRQQTRSKAFVTWSIFTHDLTRTHASTHPCTHKHKHILSV